MTDRACGMQGLATVRAFRVQEDHAARQAEALQERLRIALPMQAVIRWLGRPLPASSLHACTHCSCLPRSCHDRTYWL